MMRYGSYFMNKDDKGGCTQCHNVHKSTVDAANPDDDGVRACTTCHAKDLNLMRHPKTAGTPFENMVSDPMSACETCHMPGDLHLFRINVDPSYTTVPLPAAFTANVSANTAPEGAYTKAVWNDLDHFNHTVPAGVYELALK